MYFDKLHVDVLMFLEHKDRELEVVIEIAKKLKREHGLSVAIASAVFDRLSSLWLIRPKVVLFHSNKTLPPIFYRVYGDRIGYACLNWEQMLSTFNKKTAKKPGDFLNKTLMKNFAWGKNYRDFLVDIGVPEENVSITGRPSLTLLRRKATRGREIRNLLARRYGLDENVRWLFFPLTCLHAFFSDAVVRRFARNADLSNEVDEALAFERRDYVRKTVHEIFRWIESLKNAQTKDFVIILRPHPIISVEEHIALFKSLFGYVPPYVFITKSESAQEWVVASDVCYTNYSSIALDAYFIKKPAYLMEPDPFPHFLKYEWFNGFRRLHAFEDLQDTLKAADTWRFQTSAVIEDEFETRLDGIHETAVFLAKLCRERESYPRPFYHRLLRGAFKEPRKYFHWRSQTKSIYMKWNVRMFTIPKGRRLDFFEFGEMKARLKEK